MAGLLRHAFAGRITMPMSQPSPQTRPQDLQLSDLSISLEPGDAAHPLIPMMRSLRLRLSPDGLRTLAGELIAEADRRAPLTLRLQVIQVGPGGVGLRLRVEKSIFGSDLATRLVLSAPDGQALRVELTDANIPAWVPLDALLEEAAKRGGGALRRDPANRSALLIDPAALLTRLGLPARFGPGQWDVATSDAGIDLVFREA
jgi:hypothetical protein